MMKAASSHNSKPKEVAMKGKLELTYQKRTGVAGAHGQFMEINLLTLFKLQADKRLKEFYLAGNFESAGDFDDIVMRYVDANDTQNVIFLQAKSKDIKAKKLGLEIFRTDSMFDLKKHFKSFIMTQNQFQKSPNVSPIFLDDFGNLKCHFVMYTNAMTDESMIDYINEVEKHPLNFVMGEKSGQAFKLKAEAAAKIFRATQTEDEIETLITLIKALSSTDCRNLQRDENFQIYHAFLTQTILVKNGNIWKFRTEFLEGAFKNENLKKLSEKTLYWFADNKIDKSTKQRTCKVAIKEHMKKLELQLPDWFENDIKFEKDVCDEFIKIATPCISDNICIISKISKKLKNNVAKFAGNVFVFDEQNAMFKFNEQTLDGEPKKVLEYLADNLTISKNEPQLKFVFRVDKFPRLSLGFTEIDPKILEFIEKLTVMTGQPGANELEKIIKQNFENLSDGERTRRHLLAKDKITKWWEQSNDTAYLRKDDKFFESILCGIHFGLKNPLKSFTGRDIELLKLHKALQQNEGCDQTVVISQMASVNGLGGIGKSELARKYANKYSDSYDGNVIWIDAETHESLVRSFRRLCADSLNMTTQNANKEEMEISSIVQQVYSYFQDRKCLFIFDNAQYLKNEDNENDSIKNFLPAEGKDLANLHFLLTSRNQNWSTAVTIKLDVFTNDEAMQLLKSSLGINDDTQNNEIKALIVALHNFPLAIQQAIAYIKQTAKKRSHFGKQFNISDYLKLFTEKTKQLLDFKFPKDCDDEYTKTTFTTWNITLSAIERAEMGREASKIINIMAYLNPDDIPVQFFAEMVDHSDDKLIQVFTLIEEYSMITLHDAKANIHRLVQSVTRITLQEANMQKCVLKKALCLTNHHTDNNLIIAGASLWNYVDQDYETVNQFQNIPRKIIVALNETMRYEQASIFGKTSLNSLKCIMGAYHQSTVTTEDNIAYALSNHGKYEEALCLYKEVLEKMTKIFRHENICTLNTKHSVATTLEKLGRYEEALCGLREVLEKETIILGPNNPSTLTTQHNLAETLSLQGKYEEALGCYKGLLEQRIKILGPEHPHTLITQNNVAQILSDQGKYKEALCCFENILENRIKVLGPEHPDTLTTQHSIASVLSKQDKYEEALCSFQELLEKSVKSFGPEHPDTLTIQQNIAVTLSSQGKYEEALCCFREVLEKRTKVLGPDHPSTLTIQHNVASTLSNYGKYKEALCSHNKVLEKRIKILGPEHPDTLTTQHSIAETLSYQGKYEEALSSFKVILEKRIIILGPDHLGTLTTEYSVATTLSKQDKYEEALCCYIRVLRKGIKILGPNHIFSFVVLYNILQFMSSQKK